MCNRPRRIVAVIGGGQATASKEDLEIAFNVGKGLVETGFRVLTGGYGGIMEAAVQGAKAAENYQDGDTIGIIQSYDKSEANDYLDIIITTGLGHARNQIIVSTGDFIVAIGGGSGTLSEIAFAWQLKKKIYAFNIKGWSGELANRTLDNKRNDKIILVKSVTHLLKLLKEEER